MQQSIFLAHAKEQALQAERLTVKLRARGYQVFFDEDSLPVGRDYDARIRRAVGSCDLFVFLISPHSISRGRYTLTELGHARRRWSNPDGVVLPVLASDTDLSIVPSYLTEATNILRPRGRFSTEVADAVDEIFQRFDEHPRKWLHELLESPLDTQRLLDEIVSARVPLNQDRVDGNTRPHPRSSDVQPSPSLNCNLSKHGELARLATQRERLVSDAPEAATSNSSTSTSTSVETVSSVPAVSSHRAMDEPVAVEDSIAVAECSAVPAVHPLGLADGVSAAVHQDEMLGRFLHTTLAVASSLSRDVGGRLTRDRRWLLAPVGCALLFTVVGIGRSHGWRQLQVVPGFGALATAAVGPHDEAHPTNGVAIAWMHTDTLLDDAVDRHSDLAGPSCAASPSVDVDGRCMNGSGGGEGGAGAASARHPSALPTAPTTTVKAPSSSPLPAATSALPAATSALPAATTAPPAATNAPLSPPSQVPVASPAPPPDPAEGSLVGRCKRVRQRCCKSHSLTTSVCFSSPSMQAQICTNKYFSCLAQP